MKLVMIQRLRCAIGPSVMINDTVIGEATAEKIIDHLKNDDVQKI